MTASVLDAIRQQTYVLLKVNRNEAEYPQPVPRPGAPIPATGSLADFNAFLEE